MAGGTNRLFQSLREGDIQVSMEIWLPLQESGWNQARVEGEVEYIGASMDKDWQSTFVIPSYLQEEYPGLDHVDDLKDPRSLAGKPLAGFCATRSRRIQDLYGMVVHVIRCNTHYSINNRR